MAVAWVKSLGCKSTALTDVHRPDFSITKKALIPLSCSDIVLLFPKYPPPRKKTQSDSKGKPQPKTHTRRSTHKPPAGPEAPIPNLAELPEGHSSRRVVEIIFRSSWSLRGAPSVEMLFRVLNPNRAVVRFEEYRASVRSRSGEARCAVDGNEMMRFCCASGGGGGGSAVYDGGVCCERVEAPGGVAIDGIRTFDGSGAAHAYGGCGVGRRAMLVCRVIAGRVRSEGDSVMVGKEELVVLDPRAVLPCFLIIYEL